MSDQVVLRTRKVLSNKLLQRRQMVVEVAHPGRPNVPRKELQEKLAALYKVKDPKLIVLFGFKTQYGGGRSTGFGLIYDNMTALTSFEPGYRLKRHGFEYTNPHEGSTRKNRHEKKNREKKLRGTDRARAKRLAKKKN